jgi:DNA repair protein RecO (recombination protein O)
MYHLYHTNAFVLGSSPVGEASRMYTLLTRDFGMVHARSQGVRLPQSKLRPHLRELCRLQVVLVRGREIWRLTGALCDVDYLRSSASIPGKVAAALRGKALLRRLVIGEEKNEAVFSLCENFLAALADDSGGLRLGSIEAVFALRLLASLGYAPPDAELIPLLSGAPEHAFRARVSPELERLSIVRVNETLRMLY